MLEHQRTHLLFKAARLQKQIDLLWQAVAVTNEFGVRATLDVVISNLELERERLAARFRTLTQKYEALFVV